MDTHFGDYWPPDFGWGGVNDPQGNPGLLVPFAFNGVSFGQMHKAAVPVFAALLTELVPNIPGGLHAGSCWCYSTTDNLPDGTRSFHSFGIAIDVNWNVNFMGDNIPDAVGQYAIPRAAASTFAAKYGCEWGGNWTGFHDDMHFEVHLTPTDAAAMAAPAPTPAPEMEDDMYLFRSSTAGAYPVLVCGSVHTVIAHQTTAAALIAAGAKSVTVSPDDYARIRSGAVAK